MNYLKSFYTYSPSVSLKLVPNNHNKFKYITQDNKIISFPTYYDKDKISGSIELKLNNNKSILIETLDIYLIGILQNKNAKITQKIFEDRIQIFGPNNPETIISEMNKFNFIFEPKNKPYETYMGESIQIKYVLTVIANIKVNNNPSEINDQVEICCLKPASNKICDEYYLNKDNNKNVNINIGIENVIHVNIILLKKNYCLDDVIVGKIKIIKSELQLNNIFLEIRREEKTNTGNTNIANCQNLAKYELVEGYPETGDEIYFRYYLNGVKNLGPSYNNNNEDKEKPFEVRYFLAFEFNDDKGYQFFKNIEIGIYRMYLDNELKQNEEDNKEKNDDKNTFLSIKNELNKK